MSETLKAIKVYFLTHENCEEIARKLLKTTRENHQIAVLAGRWFAHFSRVYLICLFFYVSLLLRPAFHLCEGFALDGNDFLAFHFLLLFELPVK